ncbi:ABC transporter permease [Terribacillus sp. DMT04]|uniref:ABC transporter permease n=1 Tax=Terribacillus sp. DMT04 TaxID=2850441 RepID=UPI001C2BDF28|nr:ABC transporter permease [Terribacillus sp. DMT04]QXE01003.1 ABC transporter permease [Terribacillus sp. DMT04]
MFKRYILTDYLKIKRKGFWLLTFLGPFGVVAMQMVNYAGDRKTYLLKQSENDWTYYLSYINSFASFALVIGIAILTSLMASIENDTNAWKQLLSLPVSKKHVYLSKFMLLAVFLLMSSILLFLFTTIQGIYLDLGDNIPFFELLKYSFYPYFASLPILALQLWIAVVSINQSIPTTTGVIGVILTYSAADLPDWMIWKWPTLVSDWNEPVLSVILGIAVGSFVYILGMIDFVRRDVK